MSFKTADKCLSNNFGCKVNKTKQNKHLFYRIIKTKRNLIQTDANKTVCS